MKFLKENETVDYSNLDWHEDWDEHPLAGLSQEVLDEIAQTFEGATEDTFWEPSTQGRNGAVFLVERDLPDEFYEAEDYVQPHFDYRKECCGLNDLTDQMCEDGRIYKLHDPKVREEVKDELRRFYNSIIIR